MDSRRVVLGALAGVRGGSNLPDALREAGLAKLPPRDRAFAQRLARHALRHRRRLLAAMRARLSRGKPDPKLEDVLLLGAAQLDSDDIPPHAAVNSTVNVAPGKLRGVVNAVLRRTLREPAAEPVEPGLRHSLPDWLVQQIARDWGGQADAVMAGLNQEPALCLRVNRRRITRDDYLTALAEQGVTAVAQGQDGLVLDKASAFEDLPGAAQGWVSVQGIAAQQAVEALELAPGQTVLDACAAPGGKTAHILERCDVVCTALDSDPARQGRTRENLVRLGLEADVRVADAAQTAGDSPSFDRILLDVPCSGTGVIRRHPDIKWLRRARDIPRLADQQQALLRALWPRLVPGGALLYCSCSILTAENDDVIAAFLQQHPDAAAEPLTLCLGEATAYGVRVAPLAACEGFYYCRLRKMPT